MVPSRICDICNKKFATSCTLNRHLREVHEKKVISKKTTSNSNCFKCVICSECCRGYKQFAMHVSLKHKIDIKKEQFEFINSEVFYSWKNKIEDEENSFFSKQRSNKTPSKNSLTVWFGCNRSGFYKSRVIERKKKLKYQGSSKISGYCPAGIKALFKEDGTVSVEYTSTHVGHNSELAHLRLKFDQRKHIAEKIAMNIPFESILDELRSSSDKFEIKREQLITKRDLYNIKKEFSLNKEAVHHPNDSLDKWDKKGSASEENCIVVYQPEAAFVEEYPLYKIEDFAVEIIIEDNEGEQKPAVIQEVGSDVEICCSVDVDKEVIRAQIDSILNNISTPEEIQVINETIKSLVPKLNALKQDNMA